LFQNNTQPAVEGTCKWVFNNKSFRSWLSPNQNSVLWITGKPGSGKTVLANFLVDSFREDAMQLQRPAIVSSLFFSFRHSLQRDRGSAKGTLLRALLYQLLENDPSILSTVSHPCSSALHIPERPEDLDHDYYQRCLGHVLSAATNTSTVFIIVDALDECAVDIQNDLLRCIEPIFNAPQSLKKVRIAITCRWVPKMEHDLRAERIDLGVENSEDISIFCSARLSTRLFESEMTVRKRILNTWSAEDESLKQLVDLITERAQGTFLWVHLVTKMLLSILPAQQYPYYIMEEWQSAVQSFPTELHLLYEELLSRTPPKYRSMSRSVLRWCLYAVRPLEENALCTALRHTDAVADEPSFLDDTLSDWTLTLCHGLVEVRPDPLSHVRIVQLAHMSVKDFLTGIGAQHLPRDAVAHTLIAKACVSYLEHNVFRIKDSNDYFFHYSIFHWGIHAEAGDRLGISQDYLVDLFQWPSAERISLWLDAYLYSNTHTRKRTSLLHVASHYGLLSTVVALLSRSTRKASWDLEDDFGYTPLHHAVMSGHVTIAAKLLEYGSTVNSLDSENRTALHVAVQSGPKGFARLLHETGIDEPKKKSMMPLQSAFRTEDVEAVKFLLENGAHVNIVDRQGKTPLLYAAQHGSVTLIRLLIDAGADPSIQNPDGGSLLTLAAASGNEMVAKLALEKEGVPGQIKWSDTSFRLSLGFAAALGLKILVHLLLSSGRFSYRNDRYVQQAFIAAVASNSEEIVLIFLELGCSPDVYDHRFGQSALSIAVASGHEAIVRLLLQYRADPNIRDIRSGNTPLMYAISRGFPNIFNLLQQYGARIELPKRNHMLEKDGWIYRIILAWINQCPRGNQGNEKSQGSSTSSTESVIGTPGPRNSPPPPSSQSRKRNRGKQVPGGDGFDSEDDSGLRKRSRNTGKTESQFACPFQKRYPERHKCNPKSTVARLK
jgi:ankyrin repeat protein